MEAPCLQSIGGEEGREGERSLPLVGGGGMHERLVAAYDRFFDTHLIRPTLK